MNQAEIDEERIKAAYDEYFARKKNMLQIEEELKIGQAAIRKRWKRRGWPLLMDHHDRSRYVTRKEDRTNKERAINGKHQCVTHKGICIICDKRPA